MTLTLLSLYMIHNITSLILDNILMFQENWDNFSPKYMKENGNWQYFMKKNNTCRKTGLLFIYFLFFRLNCGELTKY